MYIKFYSILGGYQFSRMEDTYVSKDPEPSLARQHYYSIQAMTSFPS